MWPILAILIDRHFIDNGKVLASAITPVNWAASVRLRLPSHLAVSDPSCPTPDSIPVAVKSARRSGDLYQLEMLLSEAKVLMHVGHHLNIVNLLGVDASSLPGLLVVMEYCRHGSLKRFLNEHRLQGAFVQGGCEPASQGFRHCGMVLSSDELVSMSYQLADALDYLAKRRIVHRDVAARNVLVADDLVVKLCDFGMARSLGDVTHCAHT